MHFDCFSNLISENNAIWFSLDLVDYRRLAKGTDPYKSACSEPAEVPAERTTGKGEGTIRKMAALDSRVHPERTLQSDYDEEVLDTIMPSICYTPTAPGIEELEVINVSLVLGMIYVYVSQGYQTFKINLRDAIPSDAKAIANLTRKMSIQKSNTPPHVDQTKLASVTASTIRSRLMKFTCVDLRFVESVHRGLDVGRGQHPSSEKEETIHPNPGRYPPITPLETD